MARQHLSKAPSIKERSMTAISLLLLIGLFSAAGAIMAYYFLKNPDILFARKTTQEPTKVATHLKFEDGEFFIPGYLLSKVKRTTLRRIIKISMTIPINWTPDQAPVLFDGSSDLSQWILAAVKQRQSLLSDRDRLTKIYRHYIAGPASSHSSGLYRYRFKSQSPYASIELFTDNLQNPTLIIRCEMQSSTLGTRLCTRQMPISSRLQIQYKFPRSQIDHWQQVHQTMQNLLKNIYRRKGV